MRALFLFPLVFVSLLLSYGCSRPAAEVNGEKIPMKVYKLAMEENMQRHAMPGQTVKESQLRDSVIQQLIGERLLLQAARGKDIAVQESEVTEEYERMITAVGQGEFDKRLQQKGITREEFRARLKDQILARKYVESLVPDDSVEEKDMKEFYRETPKMFIHPKQVLVRLIQTETEESAKEIIRQLKEKKRNFDAVADEADKEKKAVVTDYGWTEPGFFSPEITEAMNTLKKGAFGGPYKGKTSFFILRVKDRKEETPKKYEEAKEEIRNILLSRRRQETVAHLVSERMKTAKIIINVK